MASKPPSPYKISPLYNMATRMTTNNSTDKPRNAAKLRRRMQIAN